MDSEEMAPVSDLDDAVISYSNISVLIEGVKTVAGAPMPIDHFIFAGFKSQEDAQKKESPIFTTKQIEDGKIIFPPLIFDSVGDYIYIIKEISSAIQGWTSDKSTYRVIITIYEEQGVLNSKVTYPDGSIHFHSVFNPEVVIIAYKKLEDWRGDEEMFEFILQEVESGKTISTAINQSGVIAFDPITYHIPGTFHYIVSENTEPKKDWEIDESNYKFTVKIFLNSDGYWKVHMEADDDLPVFINTFNSLDKKIDIALYAKVTTFGNYLASGQFKFTIRNEAGEIEVSTDQVELLNSNTIGVVVFPMLSFTRSGSFVYTVEQEAIIPSDWTIDMRAYQIIVTTQRRKDGSLNHQIQYSSGLPHFINICAKDDCPLPPRPQHYSSISRREKPHNSQIVLPCQTCDKNIFS